MLQEIQVLQEMLDTVKDEDEQRALEEDITGKILLTCCLGICSEVEHVPAKVVDYILNEKPGDTDDIRTRTQRLTDIGLMFRNAYISSERHRKIFYGGLLMMQGRARRNISYSSTRSHKVCYKRAQLCVSDL
ncbi:hypothetical protein EDD17DRAFT_1617129 [Pisolithus thermaeus]|nr:hypothetical protein F5141DRAFT_1133092 [Pisolithus sp. B1]KAI6159022.1 hypothetical protein EDD17DRAFT_1617129 [Pisolithus thermaeus]